MRKYAAMKREVKKLAEKVNISYEDMALSLVMMLLSDEQLHKVIEEHELGRHGEIHRLIEQLSKEAVLYLSQEKIPLTSDRTALKKINERRNLNEEKRI
ncbi:hypothetical protein [Enterococcus sp. DIV0098]|uniref:hypothetical protein n=1 Tax=Enterococcus sp. DIV0098 TaxID=2774843 RepID=UPI003F20BD34